MTEKWRKDVKSVEKFFVLDRNRKDLFFGDKWYLEKGYKIQPFWLSLCAV